jgi:Thioredoxin
VRIHIFHQYSVSYSRNAHVRYFTNHGTYVRFLVFGACLFFLLMQDWCSHCRALAPTWEKFAEIMHDVEEKVLSHVGQDYTEEEYAKAKVLHLPVRPVHYYAGHVACVSFVLLLLILAYLLLLTGFDWSSRLRRTSSAVSRATNTRISNHGSIRKW